MKKILLGVLSLTLVGLFTKPASAQIEKGNIMVGADVLNMDAQFGHNSRFSFELDPKLGYFISDNIVIGGQFGLRYETIRHAGHTITYDIGAFGRYYFNPSEITPFLSHSRFFAEANLGVGGDNEGTTGLSFGVGPGYSYFITSNVGLEALVKLHGIAGSGSRVGLGLGIGFQIYLPGHKIKSAL